MVKRNASDSKRAPKPCVTLGSSHKDVSKAVSHNMTCKWVRKSVADRSTVRQYTTCG